MDETPWPDNAAAVRDPVVARYRASERESFSNWFETCAVRFPDPESSRLSQLIVRDMTQ